MKLWLRVFFNAFILLGAFLFAENLIAEELPAQTEDPFACLAPPEDSELDLKLLDTIDVPRDYLSQKIIELSLSIDHFFGDERYFQENNKSVIQLEFNETLGPNGSRIPGFEGKAKLDLPAAEKRFHFVLESNPEKKATGDVKKEQTVVQKGDATPAAEKYAAALRYEQGEESHWHLSSDAGVKFQFPLDPFVRVRGSYSIPVGEWRLKIAETVFWFNTIGLGETTQFDMERVISPPVLFRATSTASCFDVVQNCDLRQDLTFFHTLTERSALQYQASVIGVGQPVLEETAYVLLMRYRYRLHKEWIFVEISPQLNFPRTDGFKMNALLLLRLEMIFGATK